MNRPDCLLVHLLARVTAPLLIQPQLTRSCHALPLAGIQAHAACLRDWVLRNCTIPQTRRPLGPVAATRTLRISAVAEGLLLAQTVPAGLMGLSGHTACVSDKPVHTAALSQGPRADLVAQAGKGHRGK